jgi:hypothetical protein
MIRFGEAASPTAWSVVVPSPADSAPHRAEKDEDQADHQKDDPDHPQDRDLGDEPNDEKYYTECDHSGLLEAG